MSGCRCPYDCSLHPRRRRICCSNPSPPCHAAPPACPMSLCPIRNDPCNRCTCSVCWEEEFLRLRKDWSDHGKYGTDIMPRQGTAGDDCCQNRCYSPGDVRRMFGLAWISNAPEYSCGGCCRPDPIEWSLELVDSNCDQRKRQVAEWIACTSAYNPQTRDPYCCDPPSELPSCSCSRRQHCRCNDEPCSCFRESQCRCSDEPPCCSKNRPLCCKSRENTNVQPSQQCTSFEDDVDHIPVKESSLCTKKCSSHLVEDPNETQVLIEDDSEPHQRRTTQVLSNHQVSSASHDRRVTKAKASINNNVILSGKLYRERSCCRDKIKEITHPQNVSCQNSSSLCPAKRHSPKALSKVTEVHNIEPYTCKRASSVQPCRIKSSGCNRTETPSLRSPPTSCRSSLMCNKHNRRPPQIDNNVLEYDSKSNSESSCDDSCECKMSKRPQRVQPIKTFVNSVKRHVSSLFGKKVAQVIISVLILLLCVLIWKFSARYAVPFLRCYQRRRNFRRCWTCKRFR